MEIRYTKTVAKAIMAMNANLKRVGLAYDPEFNKCTKEEKAVLDAALAEYAAGDVISDSEYRLELIKKAPLPRGFSITSVIRYGDNKNFYCFVAG